VLRKSKKSETEKHIKRTNKKYLKDKLRKSKKSETDIAKYAFN
jgi:hypothetical protein